MSCAASLESIAPVGRCSHREHRGHRFRSQNEVVVELKAVKDFEDIHIATILSYLRATEQRVGLLINFNKPRLVDGVKRLQC